MRQIRAYVSDSEEYDEHARLEAIKTGELDFIKTGCCGFG